MRRTYCPSCLNTFTGDPDVCPSLMCASPRPSEGWGELLGPGDVFDRHYHIDRLLALAGAGLTYLAREIDAEGKPQPPELAIKVLYAHRVNKAFVRRLANEAQVLRELDHPNIVEYQGFVQRRNSPPYLITTFERGGTLFEHIRRMGALPADVAASIAAQILGALEQAHRRGVVHRDLKPQNVLLREAVATEVVPAVRVADFGIAKLADGMVGGVTQAGMFVGTPEFAAPEQFLGQPATPATDVFSLGALLHYLVTARAPMGLTQRGDLATCYEELLAAIPLQLTAEESALPGMATIQEVLDGTMQAQPEKRWAIGRILLALGELLSPPAAAGTAKAPPPDVEPTPVMPIWNTDGTTFSWAPVDAPPASPDPGLSSPRATKVPAKVAAPAPASLPPPPAEEAFDAPPPPVPTPVMVQEVSGQTSERRAINPNALTLDDLFAVSVHDYDPKPVATVNRNLKEVAGDTTAPRPLPGPRPPPRAAAARPAEPPRRGPAAGDALTFPPPVDDSAPNPLPTDPASLVRLLASAPFDRRGEVVRALERGDPQAVARLASAWRSGVDPLLGEGLAFYAAATGRTDWASRLRGFLADPEPRVRWAAATALGTVGLVASISALQALFRDADEDVRVAAVRALTRAAVRAQRPDLGRSALRLLPEDASRRVREAVIAAMGELG